MYSQFHGACYRCGGRGTDPTHKQWGFPVDWTDEQIRTFLDTQAEKNAKAREQRAEKKAAKLQREQDQFLSNLTNEQRDEFKALLDLSWEEIGNGFITDVLSKYRQYGSLSPKQVDAILAARRRDVERQAGWAKEAAEAAPVTPGRYTVTGTVVSAKWKSTQFGLTLKMVVKLEDGAKVWGTVPKDILRELPEVTDAEYYGEPDESALIGAEVSFDATVEVSDKDETFGFFKRPTKASVTLKEVAA